MRGPDQPRSTVSEARELTLPAMSGRSAKSPRAVVRSRSRPKAEVAALTIDPEIDAIARTGRQSEGIEIALDWQLAWRFVLTMMSSCTLLPVAVRNPKIRASEVVVPVVFARCVAHPGFQRALCRDDCYSPLDDACLNEHRRPRRRLPLPSEGRAADNELRRRFLVSLAGAHNTNSTFADLAGMSGCRPCSKLLRSM